MVQTFPSNRADESLGVWILPGAAGRREDFLDLERSDTRPNVAAINAVPIPQEIARRPEPAKPFALPPDDSVRLNVD